MNNTRNWMVIVLLLLCPGYVLMAQGKKVKKTVFIIVDGVPADVMEKLELPNFQAIAKAGGYTRAYVGGVKGTYSQTPTISAVGYNSVLTGTWVNKHNVWGNDIKAPNYHYYTIFRYLKEQYPQKKTAVFSTWLDNRTKLVGDNIPATGNIALDYHYDGLELDTVQFPHDKKSKYLNDIDESVTLHAAAAIKNEAPDLSWVYLEYTDDMGHAFGDSPEFVNAIKEADRRVGVIWQAIQYRQQQFNEEWLLVITTDHGRTASNGKGHGGQSDRERSSWLYTNAKGLNEEFHHPQASVVDIMPSIARFMDIRVPAENAREVDGIPFMGKLSFINPSFDYSDSTAIKITWKPVGKQEKVKVWMSTTNDFKTGGKDKYELVKTVPLDKGFVEIKTGGKPVPFAKIVLEGEHNTANSWQQPK